MSGRPGVEESYLRATVSSNLRVVADERTDADKLLAAAYAVSGDPRKKMALRVYRMRVKGDMAGARDLANDLAGLMRQKSKQRRSSYLKMSASHMTHSHLYRVALAVLKWWQMPACPACEGRGHPKVLNSPAIYETRDCPECHGTGVRPVERLVSQEHVEIARWLVSDMDGLCSMIFNDMAGLLSNRMNLEMP